MATLEREIICQGPVVLFRWRNAPGWPVEYASPNAAEVFGWTAEQFVRGEIAYADLISESSQARVAREVEEATRSGATQFVHEPYEIVRRDGARRWLYDATRIVRDERGEATHYIGYVIDVTERVEAEQAKAALEAQLLHAQKMESLGLLAGGIAHDFNNLLTGILGHAALALRETAVAQPELKEHLEQIDKLARNAADLTRQLLAYSGRGRFVVEPCDVGALVEEMSGMLGLVLDPGATLSVERPDEPATVMGDRTQLQQVVMNLLTNASDALMGRRGRISVRVYEEDLDEATCARRYGDWPLRPGRHVLLEVRDDGVGMDADTLRRLFDPFFTTKDSGRGLGMSAVVGIVRGHRGGLRVESAPGQGTTFVVALPRTEAPTRADAPVEAGDDWAGSGTALVVDDQAEVRAVASRILEHLGFDTLCAASGERALELFRAHRERIVLALVDLTMPGMTGREVLAALREEDPELAVVLSSGYDQADPASTTGARASGFLHKPYRIDEARELLRRVLAQPRTKSS